MQKKALQDLATKPLRPRDIDDLEALARAHEDLAYRYRSAISMMRKRMQAEQQPAASIDKQRTRRPPANQPG